MMNHRAAVPAQILIALSGLGLAFACSSDDDDKCSGSVFECGAGNLAEGEPDSGPGSVGGGHGLGGGGSIIDEPAGGSGGISAEDQCDGVDYAAEALPVDMYIMLDKSTSMEEQLSGSPTSKWEATRAAIQEFVNAPQASGIGVGIQYFGLADACNPDAYASPAVPIARLPAGAGDIVTSTNAQVPNTLTPTAPALEGALKYMQSWAAANPDRASVVVLATDGFPTQCGVSCAVNEDCVSGTCEGGMCTPNSISEIEEVAARYAEADPPVLTFVIGIAEGFANINAIARGGGTGQAFIIDSGDVKTAFLNAMLSIASTPLSCEFDFPDDPDDPNLIVDKDLVSVVYAPAATRVEEPILKLPGASACVANNGEGWFFDDEANPKKIYVCPDTCESFAAGRVSVRVGCRPEVFVPK